MPLEIRHSIVLILTIFAGFIFPKTPLGEYEFQVIAVLFIAYFLWKRIFGQTKGLSLLESVVFTFSIVSIVNSTGGTVSAYFFLIYFLLFSLSLLLEPVIAIITTLTLVVFFLLSFPENSSFTGLIPVFSLAILTPFAMFMAKETLRAKKEEIKTKTVENKLTTTRQDALLFLSLMIKTHLKTIRSAVENFVGDHQLDEIGKSAKKMEKLIEKFEKEI